MDCASRHPLHRIVRRNLQRRCAVVSGVDDQWQADLTALPKSENVQINNGLTFVLIVVEEFSNVAWAEPLKNKACNYVFKDFTKTLFLYTDQGHTQGVWV